MTEPTVTVVIPAYHAMATLPLVLDALAHQNREAAHEIVVVDSSGDDAVARLAPWPAVRVIAPTERTLPGEARNIGARANDSTWIAFLDADAIPCEGWLDALLERAVTAPEVDAVAGSVLNGTPRSLVGTAGWLLEFSEFQPRRRHPARHGATCNLLIRRSTLLAMGGFAEDVWPGEDTIATFPLACSGRLAFAPHASVAHLNRTGAVEFLRHQRRLGASFGVVCERVRFPHGWLARGPWKIFAGGLRLLALSRRLLEQPGHRFRALACTPLLVLGVTAWTIGLVSGA